MKLVSGFFVLAIVGLLAGCSGYSAPEMLHRAQPVGSPFNKYLAEQYKTLSDHLHGADQVYFAKKGLAAVDGMFVQPERLEGRDITGPNAAEMAESRGELLILLNDGGRDRAPDLAAVAQTRFDCWTTIQGGRFLRQRSPAFPGENISCQQQFHAVITSLRQALAVAPPPTNMPPPAQPAPQENYSAGGDEEFPAPITASGPNTAPAATEQLSFLVFFDWNKFTISPSADDVLDTVAHDIQNRSDINVVNIGGYTDASGGEKYNLKLSQKRAEAVRKVLLRHGIAAEKIKTSGHGKDDQLVKTPDGVREPQNRRAQITFN